jgi:hypothetical protein
MKILVAFALLCAALPARSEMSPDAPANAVRDASSAALHLHPRFSLSDSLAANSPTPAPSATAGGHRWLFVTGEALAGPIAGLAGTLLASGLILGFDLDSPMRSSLSAGLLVVIPAASAGFGAWAVGSLEPGFDRHWHIALIGAGAGALIAAGTSAALASTQSPSPGIELAYALAMLVAGTPVLSGVGSAIALEVFGRSPEGFAVVPAQLGRTGTGVAFVTAW